MLRLPRPAREFRVVSWMRLLETYCVNTDWKSILPIVSVMVSVSISMSRQACMGVVRQKLNVVWSLR